VPPRLQLHQGQQVPADPGAVDGQAPAVRLTRRQDMLVGATVMLVTYTGEACQRGVTTGRLIASYAYVITCVPAWGVGLGVQARCSSVPT